MSYDIDIALEPKPFVYDICMKRLYRREWMRKWRESPENRERELAQQRAYRRELRVGAVMARVGRFEDHPGAD